MMDGYYVINEDQGQNESNVSARFELHPQLHPAKSHAADKPVYVDVPIVFIRVRDDETQSKIAHIVTEEHKRRFPKQWAEFEAENRVPETGTHLRMWPAITPAKLKEFTAAGIVTVEQLAAASDREIGSEADTWRERARSWLNPNAEIEALRAQLAASQAQVAALGERRGPGRPRKEEAHG